MRFARRWILPLVLLAAAWPAPAQYGPDDDDIRQTVARVAYVSGDVSFNRGDDPDAWDAATLNFPMTIGDRIWAGRGGRAELQALGAYLFVDAETELAVLNMTEDVRQLSLVQGTVSVRVHRLGDDDVFEVDTPNAAVTFESAGDYRLDVDADGRSRVVVRRGRALVASGGGQVPLEAGDEMSIDGFDRPRYDVYAAGRLDGWDRWVEQRARRWRSTRYAAYVNEDVIGYQDLAGYGTWGSVPGYGACWTPSSVGVGWAPYRDGRWVWQDPWGWSWVATEPWGFAPYHYGRWITHSSRWWWVPAAPRVRVRYAPALVAFVGGGPGWSASVSIHGGYLGWFPLAPADPFIPWWGRHAQTFAPHVTYVNRSYVTVVDRNVFVSGRVVSNHFVRDQRVIRSVESAPVLRGPIPVVPVAGSIRISTELSGRAVGRPPASLRGREVVTRLAPPPAPPPFSAKVEYIRENGGAPVAPAAATRLSMDRSREVRTTVPVRPAAQERVDFAPRRTDASGPRPVEVTAPRGRTLATSERPVYVQQQPQQQQPRTFEREQPPTRTQESRPAPRTYEREQPPARTQESQPAPRTYEREQPPTRAQESRPAPRTYEREQPPTRAQETQPPTRTFEQQQPPPTRTYERERPQPRPVERQPQVEERKETPSRIELQRPAERPVARPPQVEERRVPAPRVERAPQQERKATPPPKEEKKDEKRKEGPRRDG